MTLSLNAVASRCLRTAATCVLSLALWTPVIDSSSARAATFTWINPGSGNFNDPSNFFPSGVPGANDFVGFDVGDTVTFPGNGAFDPAVNYASSNLWVRDSGLTFSGSTQAGRGPSTYTVTSTTQTEANRGIIIGVLGGDNAVLNVSHSGIVCCGGLSSFNGVAATLGDAASASGTLNMNTGVFNITGSNAGETQLIIGNNGSGALNVNNGADVNVLGSNSRTSLGHHATGSGAVTVSGVGSTWTSANELWIGENGPGTFTVQNGGSLVTNGSGGTASSSIGTFAGGNGMVTVTGPGSTWTSNSNLRVGNSGSGTLMIANGGQLNHNSIFAPVEIGSNASGTATVTGPGSSLTTSGTLYIGSTGTGALAIQNGGSATSGRALIRGLNSGSGQVLVAGAGSTWNVTNVLEIGLPEAGFTTGSTTLTINPGATVTVGQEIDLDTNGLIRLQGGTLTAKAIQSNDLVSLNFEGTFEWTSGTLHVGTLFGSATNQAGTLAPGLGAGRTTLAGNYTQQAAATMEIEIGGATPETQHDFVYLEGAANLNGDLDLALFNNFTPTPAQTFTILESVSGIAGAFSNVANGQRLTTVDGMGSFRVNYGASSPLDPNKVILTNFEQIFLAADFNEDGDVDGDDLAAWRAGFGANGAATHGQGDADGDLDVDGGDFLAWQRQLGSPATIAARAQAVPEPGTLALVWLAGCGVAILRSRNC